MSSLENVWRLHNISLRRCVSKVHQTVAKTQRYPHPLTT
jgi:hypothetical protein